MKIYIYIIVASHNNCLCYVKSRRVCAKSISIYSKTCACLNISSSNWSNHHILIIALCFSIIEYLNLVIWCCNWSSSIKLNIYLYSIIHSIPIWYANHSFCCGVRFANHRNTWLCCWTNTSYGMAWLNAISRINKFVFKIYL